MDKETKKYLEELSSDYINLTLDYNTFERIIKDIKSILKTKSTDTAKIEKIKKVIKKYEA